MTQSLKPEDSITAVSGVSGRREQALRSLGLQTVGELVGYYPFRYNDFTDIRPIRDLRIGQQQTILGTVDSVEVKNIRRPHRRPLSIIEAAVIDDTGVAYATWFGQPWLAQQVAKGRRILLSGTPQLSYGFMRMSGPLHVELDEDDDPQQLGMQPVYRVCSGLQLGWMRRIMRAALASLEPLPEVLPAELVARYRLTDERTALRWLHFPDNHEQHRQALRRLKYQEVFFLQKDLAQEHAAELARGGGQGHAQDFHQPLLTRMSELLPFKLTESQRSATTQILHDMAAPQPMNRFLDGDVGSGKTVVAAIALVCAAANGHQAAMMAPTTVLSNQYAQKLGALLDDLDLTHATLNSETPAAERQRILAGLSDGTLQIVFGTTALVQKNVRFKDLTLAVIDEQHRFGVDQREALRRKGSNPDYLALSATPIPRTLALTLYGDMQTSYLQSRPGKAPVKTVAWPKARISDVYKAIREAAARGEQTYVICPLIGDKPKSPGTKEASAPAKIPPFQGGARRAGVVSDPQDAEPSEYTYHYIDRLFDYDDTDEIKAAEREVADLRRILPGLTIELMTSKLKPQEKHQVMEDFYSGKTQVLVSTTVVEVGVDVPNATQMVIFDADRFGLAQLHQLRGRIGRGTRPATVYLLSSTKDDAALTRLGAMAASDDGLELATLDLKQRREGDVLGLSQSGRSPLKLTNVITDAVLIRCAHDDVAAIYGS